jgi:hypothetical protein
MHRSSSRATRWPVVRYFVLMLCLGAVPRPALADEPVAKLVSRGLELRRERRDSEALALFQSAFAASATPMILAQIALAEQALGRWLPAEQHLTSALSTHDKWVERNRVALERALGLIQSHLSWLVVTTNVESAQLWLGDRDLGTVRAAPWRVTSGTHELSLRLTDGRSTVRSVNLAAGEREHFHIEFSQPSPSTPCKTSGAQAARVPSSKIEHQASTRQTLAYASAALSVGALAGAVTASLLRLDYANRYNSEACAPDRSQQCAPYREVADTLGTVAVVGYVVAGAAALGSVALFTAPYWVPSRGPGGAQAGLSVTGTF